LLHRTTVDSDDFVPTAGGGGGEYTA